MEFYIKIFIAVIIGLVFIVEIIRMILSEITAKNKAKSIKCKFVEYNGMPVIEGWPEKIEKSQSILTYCIGGKEYERIRYGDEKEDWGADKAPCHDCAVIKGQLHVLGCDAEQCPACGGQPGGCGCEYEENYNE